MLPEDVDDTELGYLQTKIFVCTIKSGKSTNKLRIDKVYPSIPINLLEKDQSFGAIKSVLTSIQPLAKE
ncbi:MAG: hypothetical protein CM15mP44_5620 [Candidatus Neomarinimicrobiota bacterium]|nr:MAG: hypothetical protein CM15mP44_5620 [Candidatus Neomarinimicrobiota bacterium]